MDNDIRLHLDLAATALGVQDKTVRAALDRINGGFG